MQICLKRAADASSCADRGRPCDHGLPGGAKTPDRLGVSYLDVRTWSADTNSLEIPTNHTLGVYPLGPDGTPGARADYQLDTFNLLGPRGGRGGTGDYQALVGRRKGFASIYVKHYPAGSPKVSDLMVAR